MSGSSASWCKETDEKINYTKLCRLLVDGGTQAVRSVFDGIHPPSSLKATLNANKAALQPLKKPRVRVLSKEQWDKLYPPCGSCPKYEEFDITLLFVLLRNICGLPAPVTGWDVLPHATDTTLQANLVRIKYYRNNTIAHKPNTELNDADFKQHWQDISSALLSLGLCQDDIDALKSVPLGEKDYNQLLYDWYMSDKDISKQLEEVKSATASQTTAIKSDTRAIKTDTAAIKTGTTAIKTDTTTIKTDSTVIKSDTGAIKTDTTAIKSDTRAIKTDTIAIKTDTTSIKTDTAAIKSDTIAIKTDTTAIKTDSTAIKSDTRAIKTDTRAIKTDTRAIKTDTTAIKTDTTAIKSDTVLLPGIQEDISQLKHIYSGTHVKDSPINQLAYSDFSSLTESLCKYFHPNTRQWILDEVKSDVYGSKSQPCGMLIKAGPGMGKSSIAAKICQTHKDLGCLAGCHFFQFNNSTRNNPRLMLQSIARQMCDTVPGYREALDSKLQTDLGKKITDMNSEELFTVLLEEPLQKLNKDEKRFVVVLDAIDECCSDFKYELLHLLKSKLSLLPFWLQFVITSRPSSATLEKTIEIDPEDPRNKHDLELFFTFKLTQIYGICDPQMVAKNLVATSKGLFLVAFFVIDFLVKNPINPISKIPKFFENGISSVYEKYFSRLKYVLLPFILEGERFYKMLEAIVATQYPIPIQMVYGILGLKSERDVPRTKKRARQDAMNSFHSLFPVEDDHVTVFHKTVVDWLTLQQDEVHDFSVCVEDGDEVLASQCHIVLSDIRNGKKDLDKPLVLTDDEKFSLTYCSDIVSLTRNELSRSLTNCYILSALICVYKVSNRYGYLKFRPGLPGFSEEMNDIFHNGVELFSRQSKGEEYVKSNIFFGKHDENCSFLNPQNFGRCLEFVVNAVERVFKKSLPIEHLRSCRLSYLEVKDIAVEVEEDCNDDVSVIACERGFLLVQETDHNTVVKKYHLDGTCLAKKTFPGTDKMLCMSTDQRNIVVANLRAKGNIAILDAKTLNLVTSYQSPDNIRSCHVYGGQPWYVVIRCSDMIYVMEGQTGMLVKTYANKLNKYVDVKAVGNQGHVLLGRQSDGNNGIAKDDADAFFMNEDGKLLKDSNGVPVPLNNLHLKHFLFHLERRDWNIPIYPPRETHAHCSCQPIYSFYDPSLPINMAFCFSDDGLLLAYHDVYSIFIINTSDGTLCKRVWLGPGGKMPRCQIMFVSQILLVVRDFTMIMFIHVETNEIKHRFYTDDWPGLFYAVPNQEGHPFTLLTHCFDDEECVNVQQYVFHNLHF